MTKRSYLTVIFANQWFIFSSPWLIDFPSFPSALQLMVRFGLLNNQPPLGSHGEVLDSLQYPIHMPNLGDTKFLRVMTS
jgi:hypothetical protein